MVKREEIGVIDGWGGWPVLSVPNSVEKCFWLLVRRLPPDIKIREIGRGYHNAGWSYLEIEVRSISISQAHEEAERLNNEIMWEFQLQAFPAERELLDAD